MASPTNPVFGSDDRIDSQTGLPESLKGKSTAEIAAYYQEREKNILRNATSAIAAAKAGNPPTNPPPPNPITRATITREELYNNPEEAFKKFQSGMITKEEFNTATAPFQQTIIRFAENLASQGKKHWNRYYAEIKGIMDAASPASQADVTAWNIAYNHVIGSHYSELETEAVRVATTPATEVPQAGSETPTAPIDLTTLKFKENPNKTAAHVCSELGISHDKYRDSMAKIDKGIFPGLTLDNRGR